MITRLGRRFRSALPIVLGITFATTLWMPRPASSQVNDEIAGTPTPATALAAAPHWRDDLSCGRSCCYILLKLMKRDVKYEDLERLIPIQSRGSNLSTMRSACEKLGLPVRTVRIQPKNFDSVRFPLIAHIMNREGGQPDMGHFIVVLAIDDHNVEVIDPSYGGLRASASRGEFFRASSGYYLMLQQSRFLDFVIPPLVLMLSVLCCAALMIRVRALRRDKKVVPILVLLACAAQTLGCGTSPATQGVDETVRYQSAERSTQSFYLTLWNTTVNAGPIRSGEPGSVGEFLIENTGGIPARLQLGTPSCACTSVQLTRDQLAPGESSTVRMIMKSGGKPGLTSASVEVVAVGQKWAHTLTTYGLVSGLDLPAHAVDLDYDKRRQAYIYGKLFVFDVKTERKVEAKLLGAFLDDQRARKYVEDHLQVLTPEVSSPSKLTTPADSVRGNLYSCEFKLGVMVKGGSHPWSTPVLTVPLQIAVDAGDVSEKRTVAVSLRPEAAGRSTR
jgi:hypothetical protein